MLVFATHFCELLPLSPSIWLNYPPSLPSLCEKVCFTRIRGVRGGGGMGFWASDR
jgi:hypothetical protein